MNNKFIPYTEQDLSYTTLEDNNAFENKDVEYLYQNFAMRLENPEKKYDAKDHNDKSIKSKQIYPKSDPAAKRNIVKKAIEYSNGCLYYGDWNISTKQKHGLGISKWPGGSIYYGQFMNDKCNGKGRLIFREGEEYNGDWVDNKAEGYGIYISDEVKYEGNWKNDKQQGLGKETWNDGTTYIGEFKYGQKTGNGKFKYINGSNYTGSFLNNQFHGKGTYVWGDGREYTGDWKFNKIDGEGEFKWPDGRKYTGHYKNDKKDGYGVFEWGDGKKYRGNWIDGKQNGEGEIYNPKDGVWTKGRWKNGRKEDGERMSSNSNWVSQSTSSFKRDLIKKDN